jgi:hypothetical protein
MHQDVVLSQPRRPAEPGGGTPAPANVDLRLDWIGTLGHTSCPLETVWRDPSLTQGIAGVYLIWSNTGGQATMLYVGNGRDIGVMLQAQHDDPRIASHAWSGDLYVSWAAVASIYRPGVTQYLMAALAPQIIETVPVAREVSVNLPI